MDYDNHHSDGQQEPEESAAQEQSWPQQPNQSSQTWQQPEEKTEQAVNDSQAYRQSIKNMKQEYKSRKREEKLRQKENAQQAQASSGGSSGNTAVTVLVSVLCTLLTVGVVFLTMTVFPSPSKSILGRYMKSLVSRENGGNELSGGQYYAPNKDTITIQDETTDPVTAVYAKVSPSIVGIRIVQVSGSLWQQSEQVVSEGTGTVYSQDGKIITNYHVIETAYKASTANTNAKYEVRVYFDTTLQEYYTAEILGGDSRTDLALLKISLTGLTPVKFADSDQLLVGAGAIVMGCGGGIEFMDSVNSGIISGLHRNITTQTGILYDLIQTDAAINPGNSGGALLNKEGQLIGICFLKISDSNYDNMAFAIPSNTVKKIISQIEDKGAADAPYIGVIIDTTYTKTIADTYNYPMGAWISSVSAGGPAEKAKLTTGDIITEYDGKAVTSFNDLRAAVNSSSIGDKVTLTIYRTTTKKEITVEITVENSATAVNS